MLTNQRKAELRDEVISLLNEMETDFHFYDIREDDFGVYIILKRENGWEPQYLEVNVSLQNALSYYFTEVDEDDDTEPEIQYYSGLDYKEMQTAMKLINWWYN